MRANVWPALPPIPVEDCTELVKDRRKRAVAANEIMAIQAATDTLRDLIEELDKTIELTAIEDETDNRLQLERPWNEGSAVVPLSIYPKLKMPSAWRARIDSTKQDTFIKRLSNRLSGLNFQFELVESPEVIGDEMEVTGDANKMEQSVPVDIILQVLREDSDNWQYAYDDENTESEQIWGVDRGASDRRYTAEYGVTTPVTYLGRVGVNPRRI